MEELFYIIPIILLVFRLISEFLKKYLSPPPSTSSHPPVESIDPTPSEQDYRNHVRDIISEVQDVRNLSKEDYLSPSTPSTSSTPSRSSYEETEKNSTTSSRQTSVVQIEEIRETLSTPQDLRKAFVIGEILRPKHDVPTL